MESSNSLLHPLRPYSNGDRDASVRLPAIGEVILIRLPHDLPGPTSIISSTAISGRNYHPCIVNRVFSYEDLGFWDMVVYVCRSFSSEANSLPPAEFNLLLPLPHQPPLENHPDGFTTPLQFEDYLTRKPWWLVAEPTTLNMGGNSAVRLFFALFIFSFPGASARTAILLSPKNGGVSGGSGGGRSSAPKGRDDPSVQGIDASGSGSSSNPVQRTTTTLGLNTDLRQQRVLLPITAKFKLVSPDSASDTDTDTDRDTDSAAGIFSSEVQFSLRDFLIAANPESPYWIEEQKRIENEWRRGLESWVEGL